MHKRKVVRHSRTPLQRLDPPFLAGFCSGSPRRNYHPKLADTANLLSPSAKLRGGGVDTPIRACKAASDNAYERTSAGLEMQGLRGTLPCDRLPSDLNLETHDTPSRKETSNYIRARPITCVSCIEKLVVTVLKARCRRKALKLSVYRAAQIK